MAFFFCLHAARVTLPWMVFVVDRSRKSSACPSGELWCRRLSHKPSCLSVQTRTRDKNLFKRSCRRKPDTGVSLKDVPVCRVAPNNVRTSVHELFKLKGLLQIHPHPVLDRKDIEQTTQDTTYRKQYRECRTPERGPPGTFLQDCPKVPGRAAPMTDYDVDH